MQAYSMETTGKMIAYNELAYPYFFIDTDADGTLSEAEAVGPTVRRLDGSAGQGGV
jgi:hypothetical protein